MSRFVKSLILFLSIIVILSNIAFAGGLSTTLTEVKIEGAKPDVIYSIKEQAGKPLIVKNTTETRSVDIAIEAEKPVDYNLVPGYEPIPDLSWVVIEKNYFENVMPGESAETDIMIKIPDDEKYSEKKYQVYIYSHTAGKDMMRMGLMSRILIETAKFPPKEK